MKKFKYTLKPKLQMLQFLTLAVSISLLLSKCGDKPGTGGGTPTPPPNPTPATSEIDAYITTSDQNSLLQKQSTVLSFTATANNYQDVVVDSTIRFQTIDGFGYTLTGGSASLLKAMSAANRTAVLQEMFGTGTNSNAVSYLRISIGASDLNSSVFSYDDMPAGQTDVNLANFNLSKDTLDLVPVLKEVLAINPNIKIMASPWSAPVWMKDNNSSIGGSLQPQYYTAYANYFVKYIQKMRTEGITIQAVTIQNEPLYGGNNPSMVMSATQQATFIKSALGPAFAAAGINTKIIAYDHNCDQPNYPITVLNDAAANPFVDGSAFHLYGGDVSAMSQVHNAYPNKNLYFTEQWTGANESFANNLTWHMKNVIIGTMNNWSKVALEWNLANDPSYNPHTPGGCTECKGALTINGQNVARNVSYYLIAHASRFIPPGSVKIGNNSLQGMPAAAFVTPAGKKVLLAVNESTNDIAFNLSYKGKKAVITLKAGAAATYTW